MPLQTERQSILTYHKQHEDAKGHYTSIADDVATRNRTETQKLSSGNSYRQQADVVRGFAMTTKSQAGTHLTQ